MQGKRQRTIHSMVGGLGLTCNQNSGEDSLIVQQIRHVIELSIIARIGPGK
jgi:hypothetical protein